MAVESVTYINNLDPSLPSGGDSIAEGDDHIRNVKKGIKATFPSVTGAVTATHTQLNDVSKISGIDNRLKDVEDYVANVAYDELGAVKYSRNSNNGTSEWVSGVVGSVTNPGGGNTFVINFKQPLPDLQYAVVITPAAAAGRPCIAYVTDQQAAFVTLNISEWNGSSIVDATGNAAFTAVIFDAHGHTQ